MLGYLGGPLSDTEMEIPESFECSTCGYARLLLKNLRALRVHFDKFPIHSCLKLKGIIYQFK